LIETRLKPQSAFQDTLRGLSYLLLLVVTVSCFNSNEGEIRTSDSSDYFSHEIARLMSKKWSANDTANYDILVSYADYECDLCKIDSISQLFALEYKHANAYLSIFYCLIGNECRESLKYVDLSKIDEVKLNEALEHLVTASELGNSKAKDILETHFKGIAKGSP